MLQAIESNSFTIISVMVFIAAVLLIEGLYLLWQSHKGPQAKRIEKRLRALSASLDHSRQAQVLKKRMLSEVPLLERLLLNLPRTDRLHKLLHESGLNWTVSQLLLTSAVTGIAGFLIMTALLHQPAFVALLAAAGCAALPMLYMMRRRRVRFSALERQLPDALDLLIRALRSGHAFSSGLKMIGEEMPEPIAGEFRIVHDEINFGVSMQQALANLSERLPITDLRYFVVAVLIQRESGGNLTEILGNISRLIRERLKLMAKVKVLSSEGRLSAWVLGIMPFALAALMNVANPSFMSPLWKDPIGIVIVKYTLALMIIGVFILRKIIKIRV
jgi:tight adherence protein B